MEAFTEPFHCFRCIATPETELCIYCQDPRTKDLPFVASNYQVPLIVVAYLYIVLKWGPDYMKDKKPYNLKTYIRCYDVFQVLMNGYILVMFARLGFFDQPTRLCIPLDYSMTPTLIEMSYTLWIGWIIRFADLTETVTFVLRKKNKQISFLHLYHHVSVIFLGWYIIRFYAVEMAAVSLIVNSCVHMFMYTYYFLSSYGDKAPKILKKVKPFITIMQLAQFVILLLHSILGYIPSCEPRMRMPATIADINLIINFILFYNFYQTTYKTQQKQKK